MRNLWSDILAPWEHPVSILFYLMVLVPLQDPLLNKLCWMLFNVVIFKCCYFFFIYSCHSSVKKNILFLLSLFHFIFRWKSYVAYRLVGSYNRCLIRKVKYKWNFKRQNQRTWTMVVHSLKESYCKSFFAKLVITC